MNNLNNPQNKSKTHYLLLLPDGIGFRNFVMTSFIDLLAEESFITIWHTIPESLVQPYQQECNGKIHWFKLPGYREGQFPYIIRRAKLLAQLKWQEEPGTEIILEYMSNRSVRGLRRLKNFSAERLAELSGYSSSHVKSLDTWHQRIVRQTKYFRDYVARLEALQPDMVFCSHQRSETAVPIMLAARKLGIPTCTFIYSWDNLPKGRMAVYADSYFVWSQHMKDEMLQYYPDIEENQIFIVGTPQFEHYFNTALVDTREAFLSRLSMDPDRPVICFSGDDQTTSPYDPDYLADLAEAIHSFPEDNRPQILFRRNPTDTSHRYDSVLEKYPEIHCSDPVWATLEDNDWSQVVPTAADTQLLANVINHCDLVINVGSTMALDFAILDKPAIYINYNPHSLNVNSAWRIEKVYRYPHFNHLKYFNPVYWVQSRNQLAQTITHALQHPQELQAERKRWVEFLVQSPVDQASSRCVTNLKALSRKR